MMPMILGTDFQPSGETEGPTFSHVQNVPKTEARSDVTAQTITTITQRLKGLETQINNMKNSISTIVESKLQETNTFRRHILKLFNGGKLVLIQAALMKAI